MIIPLRRLETFIYCKDWLVGECHPGEVTVIYKQNPVDWDNVPNQEHLLIAAHEEDEFNERQRITMFREGFWWANRNPIAPHPDGGILVVEDLALSPEICFSSPWTPPVNGYNQSPWCYGFFARAVPLALKPQYMIDPYWGNRVNEDGFFIDCFLVFAEDFFDD